MPRILRTFQLFATVLALSGGPVSALEPWGRGEDGVVFSEVHYHPPGDVAEEEFVEIANSGVQWVDVGGWRLAGGVRYTFPEGTVLGPGEHLAVARSAARLAEREGGGRVIGDFEGRLGNAGEVLVLENRTGRRIAFLHYRDGRGPEGGLWPRGADGRGASLELITAPHSEWDRAWRWDSSHALGGTPGFANSVAVRAPSPGAPRDLSRRDGGRERDPLLDLSINEVCLGPPSAFVELHNDGPSRRDLDGLRLGLGGDTGPTGGTSPARALTGPLSGTLAAGARALVDAEGVAELLAALAAGEDPRSLRLLGPRGELIDAVELPALPPGGAAGRYPDGGRDAVVLDGPSPGRPNTIPVPAGIVIHEILYHGIEDDGSGEFIELHNPTRSRVELGGWTLDDAVRFRFPDGAGIGAGGYIAVAKNPEHIAARLRSGSAEDVLGPYKGQLANRGETIVLRDAGGREVDRVRYADSPPWHPDADGQGASLELRNAALDNRVPAAWTRGGPGGSPAEVNRNHHELVLPEVAAVRHEPAVPAPGDAVTVYAHVISTRRIREVRVLFRLLGVETKPVSKRMTEEPSSAGGDVRSGRYTARLELPSRLPESAVVGYRFLVRPSSGRAVEAPAAGDDFLMPVESPARRPDGMLSYHVVMTPEDAERFGKEPRRSEAWFPCTFAVASSGSGLRNGIGAVYHGAEIRLRGNNSRNPPDGRMSYRLKLPGGALFDGRDRLILNSYSADRQKAGGDIMKEAGLPAPRVANVRLVAPGRNDVRCVDVEVVDENFLGHHFASRDGELFRGRRGRPFGADLAMHGRDNIDEYLAVYERVNYKDSRDISGLLDLLDAFATPDDSLYLERVEKLVDVPLWVTYFAANNLLGNTEGGLSVGDPDDYFLTRRVDDGRWIIVPWDHDSTFHDPRMELFTPKLPALRRFLRHPAIALLYHERVRELLDGPLSGPSFARTTVELSRTFAEEGLDTLWRFVEERHTAVRERYCLWPHAALGKADAPGTGFGARLFVAPGARDVDLWGFSDPARTYAVDAGGRTADYSAVSGRWEAAVPFGGGASTVWVRFLGRDGLPRLSRPIRLEESRPPRRIPSVLSGRTVWTEEGGPYLLEGVVTVSPGATLEIGPGTEVLCGPKALLIVKGRLEAAGTPARPVSFRLASWKEPWQGLWLAPAAGAAGGEQRIAHCRFEGGAGQGGSNAAPAQGSGEETAAGSAPFIRVTGAKARLEGCVLRGIRGHAVGGYRATLTLEDTTIVESRHGVVSSDGSLEMRNARLRSIWGRAVAIHGPRGGESAIARSTIRSADIAGLVIDGAAVRLDDVVVAGSAVGLDASGGARVRGERVTLAACGIGVLVDQKISRAGGGAPDASRADGSEVSLAHSTLSPNGHEVLARAGAELRFEACRLLWPGSVPGSAVVRDARRERVEFVSPLEGDYRVRLAARSE